MWAAMHLDSGTPAAIKCLHGPSASLEQEVRAMARLHHPHVIEVFELGQEEGQPWFAMSRAYGSLAKWQAQAPWPRLARWLSQLIEALAHAHARGLVHRDLKPSNVLLDATGSVRLADFGVAWAQGPSAPYAVGTAAYMAPEQLTHAWRDFGPWTDLYALGCLVWAMVTGDPPFGHLSVQNLIEAHRTHRLPPLRSTIDVPADLEAWLQTLLAKAPEERPELAADALATLPSGPCVIPASPQPRARRAPATVTHDLPPSATPPRPIPAGPPAPPTPRPSRWPDPWIPEAPRWSVGLGLLPVRTVPLIGRDPHRQALWDALQTAASCNAQRRAITGPVGIGKSHLAQALLHAAHETGAALVWAQGPRSLRSMLRAQLRADTPDVLMAMLQRRRVPHAARLARWLSGQGLPTEALLEALHGWLSTRSRPVVWWLDEPDDDTLELAERLTEGRLRLLAVMTHARPRPSPAWPSTSLGPLSAADMQRLLRSLVGLEDGLAAQIEARAEGRAADALGWVRDWAARGWLRPTPQGFVLTVSEGLFTSLDDPWRARLARWAEHHDLAAMAVAATYGRTVPRPLWEAACDDLGIAADASVALREGLAQVTDTELQLTSELRHALLATAHPTEPQAWSSALHRALPNHADAGLRARLLLGAGRTEEAVPALLAAAHQAAQHGRLAEGLDLLQRHDDAVGPPPTEESRVLRARLLRARGHVDDAAHALGDLHTPEALHLRSGLALDRMHLDHAEALAHQALAAADSGSVVAARAAAQLGNVARRRGDGPGTRHWMRRAVALLELDDLERGWSWHALALAEAQSGNDTAAAEGFRKALTAYEAAARVSNAASCELELGNVAQRAGDLVEARRRWQWALARFERVGNSDAALPRLNLALADLVDGHDHAARRGLLAARIEFERLGREGMVAAVHACLLPLVAGEPDATAFELHLAEARSGLVRTGFRDPTVRWAVQRARQRAAAAGWPERAMRLEVLMQALADQPDPTPRG